MSKRKLDKTDIGEMQCWASSALHSGFPKVQVDSDHMIELCERALDNSRLTEENAKLRKMLTQLQIEGGLGVARHRQIDRLLNQLKEQTNDK